LWLSRSILNAVLNAVHAFWRINLTGVVYSAQE
jgi:hypothetical protein